MPPNSKLHNQELLTVQKWVRNQKVLYSFVCGFFFLEVNLRSFISSISMLQGTEAQPRQHTHMEGSSVSFHWVAVISTVCGHRLQKKNWSLHPGKIQAWMKSLRGIQKHVSPCAFGDELNWGEDLQISYCLTHWYMPITQSYIDYCLDHYSIAAMYTILSIVENALGCRKIFKYISFLSSIFNS